MVHRCLFVSSFLQEEGAVSFGGNLTSIRNLEHIERVLGEGNVFRYVVQEKSSNLYTKVKGYFLSFKSLSLYGFCKEDWANISRLIDEMGIDIVFLDSSLFGGLAKLLKCEKKVTVMTFFHNVESFFVYSALTTLLYYNYPRLLLTYLSEKETVKYSDVLITLNERDSSLVNCLYKRIPEYVVPISLTDNVPSCNQERQSAIKVSNELNMLFVGSHFYANTHGITWFVKKVLKNIPGKLYIVGKNMELLKRKRVFNNERIVISNSVPSLDIYYAQADLVILPIFKGSGMKVKTAEALMFGKMIVGTTEAFTGYNLDNKCARKCDSSEEFINAISSLANEKVEKWNISSRKLYELSYSWSNTQPLFKQILADVCS